MKNYDFMKRLMKSRFFLGSFFLIVGIMTVLFLLISMVTYKKSRSILENEFTASSKYRLEVTARAVDNFLMDMRYIGATLDTSQMVQAFFAFQQPDLIYDDFYGKIQENLKAYVNGYSAIDSIYLYSECAATVLTSSEKMTASNFMDKNWMDAFVEEPEKFKIFFRSKNDAYPFLLCIMKQLKVNGFHAAIVININLSKLSHLTEITQEPYQEMFLISDEGQILFRNRQRELKEELSAVSQLYHFQPQQETYTTLAAGKTDPYTYTQIHSADYPWSYSLVTHLQEYTNRLSSTKAISTAIFLAFFSASVLLAFLFSLRSVRPIQNLLRLLQNPQETISKELYSDKEISFLAGQITSYIQQNQSLSDELSSRLNLLNKSKLLALQSQINPHFLFNTLNMIHILESEALGYEHMIPSITLNLSKLLRYAMESTDLVSLDTELNFTRLYLDILTRRYGNRPQVEYDIDRAALSCRVPKLFIQPLIENAIFHGLAENMDDKSTLTLSCQCREDSCLVSVRDNGVGMMPETLERLRYILEDSTPPKGSIGLKNVATRMNLLYGDSFRILINSSPGQGSVFTLRFPMIKDSSDYPSLL